MLPRKKRHTLFKAPCFFKKKNIVALYFPFQRNRHPLPRLHPHAESSADQMEPLDPEVKLPTPSQPPLQRAFHPRAVCFQSRRGPEQRYGHPSGDEEKSQRVASRQVSCQHAGFTWRRSEVISDGCFFLTVGPLPGHPLTSTGSCCVKVSL